ncbi:putative entry exclusion protein TrbK-alt [Bradyrhizobium hipponense]|uniref:Putative entry exclusion protein TrbK-alt n=1 Tax=Bradyrhizobium hipponense TaxID=2605638 RepID=A0A5S4YIB2_9BRAD|nr:putative entry exclusion protein TrbK-alt [Bradyrhizobium hipponense]TYO63344.1 putative entry exclusion protein TrbK-alt [Bradyrhizobium hipponense]
MTTRFERLPALIALALAVLVVAACAIRLRDNETETAQSRAALDHVENPVAAKLERCRAVTYEQRDALLECQKIWAEQRRQFLKKNDSFSPRSDSEPASAGPASPVPPKDNSRLPSGYPTVPAQSE